MSRNTVIAVIVSILVHSGTAASGYLFKGKPAPVAKAAEIPSIALDQPAPPEPEPEVADDTPQARAESVDLAPPTQADLPNATITSDFVQPTQPVIALNLNRQPSISIPTNTRPSAAGANLGKVFDLGALDQRPEARVQIKPVYPNALKRSGVHKGEVTVGFVVDKNGEVVDPYIIKSTHSGFDEAALQAVLKSKYKPGKKGGTAVNTRVALPVAFNLEA